jgi:hypothetical protein
LPYLSPKQGCNLGIKREFTRFLCAYLGVKELRKEAPSSTKTRGMPNKEEGSKQRSRSAVSRLNGKKGRDIQAYPRWRHTLSKDQTTRLIWEARQDLVYQEKL